MKTYLLTVSRTFPKTHKRTGQETYFVGRILSELILSGLIDRNVAERLKINMDLFFPCNPKLHTIRSNYELWAKRVKKIQEGKAILSIRYWSGKPYNSKQVEICQLDKNSGIGVQKLGFYYDRIDEPFIDTPEQHIGYVGKTNLFAKNDGLSLEDFKDWFRKYDLNKPMAIIHFTTFRY